MIYLAPLQGFTDFVYRKVYAQVFGYVDAFFIPYISMKNGVLLPKYIKEIKPENNTQARVVPQVLAKDGNELLAMAHLLQGYGYKEINFNVGCPYPMVTNRGKGSGLLPYPEKVKEILAAFFEKQSMELSVKLRAGLEHEKELKQIIPVLNGFPLKEVILHPRIAKQLYEGKISDEAFRYTSEHIKHKLVFNGDIFSAETMKYRRKQFPGVSDWMLGRGILMNSFLPAEIQGECISDMEKRDKLLEFHSLMLEQYLKIMDNEGNALNKMKQFWSYFSYNFPNQKKAMKAVKKSSNILKYKAEVQYLFAQL